MPSIRSAPKCTPADSLPPRPGSSQMQTSSARGAGLTEVVAHLDELLRINDIPDYSGAVNGLQVENDGPITRAAVAVDASLAAIQGAIDGGANLLLVHHGLFWSGVQPLRGRTYERFRRIITAN